MDTLVEMVAPMKPDQRIEAYRRMRLIRTFEETVSRLLASGELYGFAHLCTGQEAAVVGACMALNSDDYMVGTHRSHGHPIGKGADPGPLMAELFGRSTGINKGMSGSMHLADFSVGSLGETSIVASGLPVAVGGALSAQLRGTGQVALAFFGDGASNEGAFHESLNMAAIWKLPVIFYCENNLYASTTAFATTNAATHVADYGAAYSMASEVVDGQDVEACYTATARAVQRARVGEGPSLIEAETYRYRSHSEGLRHVDPRPEAEVTAWLARDPVLTYRSKLLVSGTTSEEDLTAIDEAVEASIALSVEMAVASPVPTMDDLYANLFSSPLDGGVD